MTPLYPPKSWDSRWRPEYGRECRFSGSTIKMLDLGDDHPVRKLLHAAWCAAIPWHLWIGVSTIPRAKNLLCRSVSGINHHYEPGPMNPPLWPSTSKLFLFHDSPRILLLMKLKIGKLLQQKGKLKRKKVQIVSSTQVRISNLILFLPHHEDEEG